MPIHIFDGSGNQIKQRPIYVFTSDGTPVPIRYVYEYDSSGTPRMVYGSGPDWLAKYNSESATAIFDTEYITGIEGLSVGKHPIYSNSGASWEYIYGMNLIHGYDDGPEGSGPNNHEETITYKIIPNRINLFGATAIQIVGSGVISASVHGHIEVETHVYMGFGGSETLLFEITGFTLDGDNIGNRIVSVNKTIPISPINDDQELYFKIHHIQRSPQNLSNSEAILSMQQINVLYA